MTKERNQLPATLPNTIHYEPYVPLGDLLSRAGLLVHHGGIGTLAQAIADGIPQVVIPLTDDQPNNARRVERLGVDVGLPPSRLQVTTLTEVIHGLLSSVEVKARCRDFAGLLNGQEAREKAADYIEQMADLRQPVEHS